MNISCQIARWLGGCGEIIRAGKIFWNGGLTVRQFKGFLIYLFAKVIHHMNNMAVLFMDDFAFLTYLERKIVESSIESVASSGLDVGVARFLGISETGDDGIRLADIRAKAASDLTDYGKVLMAALDKMGIRIPPAIQLHSPDEGHVVALGDNAGVAQVTDLINNDTVLLKRFKEIEVLHVLIRRAELRLAGQPMTSQHFNLGLTSLGCIAFFTEA